MIKNRYLRFVVNANVAAQGVEPGCLAGARHRRAYWKLSYFTYTKSSSGSTRQVMNSHFSQTCLPLGRLSDSQLLDLHEPCDKSHHSGVTKLLNTVSAHFRIRCGPARHLRQPLSDTSRGLIFSTHKTPLRGLTRVPWVAEPRSPALGCTRSFNHTC